MEGERVVLQLEGDAGLQYTHLLRDCDVRTLYQLFKLVFGRCLTNTHPHYNSQISLGIVPTNKLRGFHRYKSTLILLRSFELRRTAVM